MPNLSDAQLELCCRALCRARGLDADELLTDYPPDGYACDVPQWMFLRHEILERHAALQAETVIREILK